MVFTAIWWSWVNFTWYASAFDSDDTAHRIGTMVIMAGALVVAAGVPEYFHSESMVLPLTGYVIMRLGLAFLWWRAAIANANEWRATATRYGVGLVVLQILWVSAAVMLKAPVLYGVLPLIILGEFIHPRFNAEQRFILPLAAVLLFATPLLPFGIYPVAAILVLAVVTKSLLGKPAIQAG